MVIGNRTRSVPGSDPDVVGNRQLDVNEMAPSDEITVWDRYMLQAGKRAASTHALEIDYFHRNSLGLV